MSGDNLAQITEFLRGKGLGAAQIAGIEGNLQVESGFSPTATNPSEGAIGIAQWEGGRRAALESYAARTGGNASSLSTQLGYLWSELTGPYKPVLNTITSTNDPAKVAQVWDVGAGGKGSGTGFENSAGTSTDTRMADARSLYQQLAASGVPTVTTGGTGTAGGTANVETAGLHWSDLYNPIQLFKDINPLSLFGGLANDAESAVVTFALEALFVLGGLALVVGGLYRASEPARDNVKQQVESAAPLAAAAV